VDTAVLAHNTEKWNRERRLAYEAARHHGLLDFDKHKNRDYFVPSSTEDFKVNGNFSIEKFQAYMTLLEHDPVRKAMHDTDMRRGVMRGDPRRNGISALATIKEPMLNASPNSISNALAYKEPGHKDRVVKNKKVYDRIVVKPTCTTAAKLEHKSSFWGERCWNIYTLRYAKGFVLVTDGGSESRVFPTYGELKVAVKKSGWEIVR
jgi:hypothetical protein